MVGVIVRGFLNKNRFNNEVENVKIRFFDRLV